MARINKKRERELVDAAEKGLAEAGYAVTKRKFKHYSVEKGGVRQNIVLRTSTNRWLGFNHGPEGWGTLGDASIDGIVIAAYENPNNPSTILVYPAIDRDNLMRRFDEALAAKTGKHAGDPRTWVCLDTSTTGKSWDTGSGIVDGLTPMARYPQEPGSSREAPELEASEIIEQVPKRNNAKRPSISMIVDLDEDEHQRFAEHFARRLETDPRRLLVEVRLTFLA